MRKRRDIAAKNKQKAYPSQFLSNQTVQAQTQQERDVINVGRFDGVSRPKNVCQDGVLAMARTISQIQTQGKVPNCSLQYMCRSTQKSCSHRHDDICGPFWGHKKHLIMCGTCWITTEIVQKSMRITVGGIVTEKRALWNVWIMLIGLIARG